LPGLLISAIAVGWSLSSGAAVLKNVQTGVATMPGGSTTATVAITSVVTARTFVICYFLVGNNNGQTDAQRVTCELPATPTATTLTITNGVQDGAEVVRWYVVEFLSGVTVQRSPAGGTAIAAATPTLGVAIAAVNLAKTFVLISARTATGSSTLDRDEQFTPTAQLTSTTNLQLTRNEIGTVAVAVAWQVVQIESAVVQSGTVSIAKNTTSITAALAPAVDMARTFLVFTSNGGDKVAGVESKYLTTGVITNATTLTFTRAVAQNGNGGQVDIQWFAVRMTDGTTVQRGTSPTAPTPGVTMNAALTSIVQARSIPIISASGDPAAGAANDALDDNSWAAAFTPPGVTSTNLQLTTSVNAQNNVNTTVAWQVIQFSNTPNLVDGDGREIFP
jgi:hypothetical protein